MSKSKLAKKPTEALEAEIVPATVGAQITHQLEQLMARRGAIIHLAAKAMDTLAFAKTFEITTQDQLELLKEALDELKADYKAEVANKEQLTKPLNHILGLVHDIYRPRLTALEQAEKLFKRAADVGLKRLTQQQTRLLQTAGSLARQGELSASREVLAQVPDAALPKGMNMRPIWRFKVARAELIPNEYLKVVTDDDKISAAIEAGVREIPGLEIYEETSVSIRKST